MRIRVSRMRVRARGSRRHYDGVEDENMCPGVMDESASRGVEDENTSPGVEDENVSPGSELYEDWDLNNSQYSTDSLKSHVMS